MRPEWIYKEGFYYYPGNLKATICPLAWIIEACYCPMSHSYGNFSTFNCFLIEHWADTEQIKMAASLEKAPGIEFGTSRSWAMSQPTFNTRAYNELQLSFP